MAGEWVKTFQVEGMQVERGNDMFLKVTGCFRAKPRGADMVHSKCLFFLFPYVFLPYQPICWSPREEDSLEKAVGSGNQPEGVDEDCSADVQVSVEQAGLPWPLASYHILATIDLPHHLGLPTHCGDNPWPMLETSVVFQMPVPGRPFSTSQMGKGRPKVK